MKIPLQDRDPDNIEFLNPSLIAVSRILNLVSVKVFIIGARSLIIHGVNLGRETRDWDVTIDKPFTPELRDTITRELRSKGFKVQWRKWGFTVEDDVHIDVNYAPLILDKEFIERSRTLAHGILIPSLEDLVILKLMSGERKDISDIKKILHQTWNVIDKEYLYRRARQAGLEKELKRILRRMNLK